MITPVKAKATPVHGRSTASNAVLNTVTTAHGSIVTAISA